VLRPKFWYGKSFRFNVPDVVAQTTETYWAIQREVARGRCMVPYSIGTYFEQKPLVGACASFMMVGTVEEVFY